MGVPVSEQNGLREAKNGISPPVDNAAAPTITVCICTRNRQQYLANAIEAVLAQECPIGSFEILVLDNGSTDKTAELVSARFGNGTKVPVRYVYEAKPGLSRARNRAVSETDSDYILFLDDDALAEPGWLSFLGAACHSAYDVVAVSGQVIPFYEAGRPSWMPPHYEGIYGTQIAGDCLRRVSYSEHPYGGNMIYRRSALLKAGAFREDLGYCGASLIPHEEKELLLRMEKAGGVIMYEPRAIIRHLISPTRSTKKYVRRRIMAGGAGSYQVERTRRSDVEKWGFRDSIAGICHSAVEIIVLWRRVLTARIASSDNAFARELACLHQIGMNKSKLQYSFSQLTRRIKSI